MKTWSWRQAILKSNLQATTKLVLLAISTYMNDHGEGCYPSQDQIALDTSLSRRAVITHIELAVQAGFLLKDKRNLKGRAWDANEYRANMPEWNAPDAPHEEGVNHVHASPSRGEPGSLEGCTTFTQGVNQVHTNSPMNSPKNSPKNSSLSDERGECDSPSAEKTEMEADFKKVLFTEGLKLLGGQPNKNRPLVGRWLRDFGEQAVVVAMLEAKRQAAVDPKAYIEKLLKQGGTHAKPRSFASQDYNAHTTGFEHN
jgi:hypothetical protein